MGTGKLVNWDAGNWKITLILMFQIPYVPVPKHLLAIDAWNELNSA
jgi:hypothetical protein